MQFILYLWVNLSFVVGVHLDIFVQMVGLDRRRLDVFQVRQSRVLGFVHLLGGTFHLFDLLFHNFSGNHGGISLQTGHCIQ